jgi:hypothetical protein
MATVTLTIALPDLEAHALAIVIASLGPEQFEHTYQHLAQPLEGQRGL